jgi:DNA polymerase-1
MFIIADGNNLGWAGFHALRRAMGAESPEEKVRAALLGLTQSVIGLVVRRGEPPADESAWFGQRAGTPVTRLAVVFDEGRPLRRRSIFPPYQTGRESDPAFTENEAFVLEAIRQFSELARSLPCEVVRGINTEADDLISALALLHEGAVRIASTDRDFLQLVDERVSIYSPVKRLVVTTANFSEATAPKTADGEAAPFPRERYLDYRAMSGDASDNLPGIPGVGTLTAARLLQKAPLDAYLDAPRTVVQALGRKNAKIEAAFHSGEAASVVARNRQLMDLRLAAESYPDLGAYTAAGAWDTVQFRAWVRDQRIAGMDLEAAVRALETIARALSPGDSPSGTGRNA